MVLAGCFHAHSCSGDRSLPSSRCPWRLPRWWGWTRAYSGRHPSPAMGSSAGSVPSRSSTVTGTDLAREERTQRRHGWSSSRRRGVWDLGPSSRTEEVLGRVPRLVRGADRGLCREGREGVHGAEVRDLQRCQGTRRRLHLHRRPDPPTLTLHVPGGCFSGGREGPNAKIVKFLDSSQAFVVQDTKIKFMCFLVYKIRQFWCTELNFVDI